MDEGNEDAILDQPAAAATPEGSFGATDRRPRLILTTPDGDEREPFGASPVEEILEDEIALVARVEPVLRTPVGQRQVNLALPEMPDDRVHVADHPRALQAREHERRRRRAEKRLARSHAVLERGRLGCRRL